MTEQNDMISCCLSYCRGSTRYLQWGHNDKLATFSNQAGSSDPTVYTNYFYNSAGERVKKITRKGQKLEVTVYVDGGLFELTYIKPTGTTIDSHRHYNTLYIKDDPSTPLRGRVIGTRRVGTNTDDATPPIKFHLDDHLGSCTVILRPNGNLVNREEFYPFGETSFGAYAFKRYRYNGKEKDEESGLYNYGQRYYAPWLCRFVSVDPIAEDYPQLSSYNYAGNKPITSVDIEG
ncbi:MAG: RHS repeat-associated core domain-containing protein, partial [Flavobacteriales bacterium]|nr:RHS repeat-associated core domain-containing protein [Flavobacteriales bacterium]